MKIFSMMFAIITGLLLFSTLVCGLWIRANEVSEASSLNFHMNIGIATVIFSTTSVTLLFLMSLKQ